MKTKNICKFITKPSTDMLETHQFILETNPLVMAEPSILRYNRVVLVNAGAVRFYIGQAQITASAGTLLFAFPDESFEAVALEGGEYLYIDFSGNRSDALFRRFGIHAGNRFFEGFDGLILLWKDSLVRAFSENIDLSAESVLLYTLSRLNASHNPQNTLMQQIIDITEESFTLPELSVAWIAKKLSYNPKYLSHLFKQKMGVGYTEYLRTYRIKYAILLMDHGIDSVKNIASLCGFSDPLYFSSVFKQTVGISPSEYKSRDAEKMDFKIPYHPEK